MGLVIYTKNWRNDYENWPSWSYSWFHSWRKYIMMKVFNENLDDMFWFWWEKKWTRKHYPLSILLNHSDCDWSISYNKLVKLLPSLLKIKNIFESEFDKQNIETLIDVSKNAIKNKKGLSFG